MKAGWQVKKLGDVCETGSGGTPLKSKKEYYEGGNIPWLLSGEVSQGEINDARNFITQKGLENSSAKLFPRDTVLVAMYGATAGQVGILRIEAATNQAVCGIFPNHNFIPEFIYYVLLSKKDALVSQATGNAQPNISQIKIRSLPIPIPPLAEQERLVAILDEAFAGIDAAKANAEQNLNNARALFDGYLAQVFSQRGEGWVERRLNKISTVLSGFSFKSSDFSLRNVVPSIKITNVGVREFIMETDSLLPGHFLETYSDFSVPAGSIVIALTRSIISGGLKVAIVPVEYDGALLNQRVAAINADESIVLQQFLYKYLCTQSVIDYVEKQANTLMQPNLSINALRDLAIPFPPLPDQQAIVAKLDALSAETKKLEAVYRQKIAALDELKQSLLHQAFTGEL